MVGSYLFDAETGDNLQNPTGETGEVPRWGRYDRFVRPFVTTGMLSPISSKVISPPRRGVA